MSGRGRVLLWAAGLAVAILWLDTTFRPSAPEPRAPTRDLTLLRKPGPEEQAYTARLAPGHFLKIRATLAETAHD